MAKSYNPIHVKIEEDPDTAFRDFSEFYGLSHNAIIETLATFIVEEVGATSDSMPDDQELPEFWQRFIKLGRRLDARNRRRS